MGKPDKTLQKLVALKRQKAEQDFLTAQQARSGVAAEGDRLKDNLKAMDRLPVDTDAHLLSLRHGHDRKLIGDIRQQQASLAERQAELEAARDKLKRAFDSENRLKDAKA